MVAPLTAGRLGPTPRLDLPPFPTGWYALCLSHELAAGAVREETWMGRRLRLERTPAGLRLRCLAGGPPPPVLERLGAVIAWFDEAGRAPLWEIPDLPEQGWSPYMGHCFAGLLTHPQETSENSVDVAHFGTVHNYTDVAVLEAAHTQGPVLEARYAFSRRALPFGFDGMPIRATFRARVLGLGFSLVEAEVAQYGLRTRQMVMSTPLDGERMDLRIGVSVHVEDPGQIHALLRLAPRGLVEWAALKGTLMGFIEDVGADLEIWQTKRHLHRPRVVSGDGPIGLYRAWCRQFYPSGAPQQN